MPTTPFLKALTAIGLMAMLGCTVGGLGGGWYDGAYYETQALTVADLDGTGLSIVSANAVFEDDWVLEGFLTTRLPSTVAPGSFLAPVRSSTGYYPVALATGDLDGDERPDAVVATYASLTSTHGVQVHLQSATQPGAFLTPTELSTGSRRPLGVVLADLQGSGRLDIVVAATGGTSLMVFFHGTTPGSFQPPVSLELGAPPTSVAAAILTGGGMDLVASTTDSTVAVLRHDTTPGTFLPCVNYPTGTEPVAVRVADIDGDEHPDLLTANFSNGTGGLSILRQDPDAPGTFMAATTVDTGDYASASLSVGLVDQDSLPDVVVANYGLYGSPGSVAVLRQDPSHPGTFLAAQMYGGYYGPIAIVLADLKGDGHPAMVIADGTPCIRFQDPDAPGTFRAPVWLSQ